jgi:CRISPR-associated exonuclease Cas4
MEQTSDLVYEGKLIHENSYPQRASKYREIEMDGIKIDFYDPIGKIIHETKKSRKEHDSHLWQLKYYIYRIEKAGVDGVTGLLEYPAERQTEEVLLSIPDREYIEEIEKEINTLVNSDFCPPLIDAAKCKKCSYCDFCFSEINNSQ